MKMIKNFSLLGALLLLGWLAGCQTTPAPAPVVQAPPPPPVYPTSFICQDGNSTVQLVVCENQSLAQQDVQLGTIYHQLLAAAGLFGDDQLLAAERGWLLALPASCNITSATPGPAQISCLAQAYQSQIASFSAWPPPPPPASAISHYVQYHLLDAKQPDLCGSLAAQAGAAMSPDGTLDPNKIAGATEIAGTHGEASGTSPGGGAITVDSQRGSPDAGYQQRSGGISVGGFMLINPHTLQDYVETLPNAGGRFASDVSQIGDYGAADVFTLNGQTLALVSDVIGYNAPTPPGEATDAGLFSLSAGAAAPLCLFQTYLMPPPVTIGIFAEQPSLTPLLAVLDQIHGLPPDGLGSSDLQDASYFSGAARWMLFNMPLVVAAQAPDAQWIGWLRRRHDDVLDALYAWSQQNPQNQALFTKLFALLRPAAIDLDTIYVQQQGLSAVQAQQATALAIMELLYQSTTYLAPGLGGDTASLANGANYKPRYPILATPGG